MSSLKPIYRYRAVKPFEEEQSMLFFGRKTETEQLAALIFSEKLTVLYGKSGYGKSSLLNAGILPRLKSENEKGQKLYVPVLIRFQTSESGGESLMVKFKFHFGRAMEKQATVMGGVTRRHPAHIKLPETLWGLFKSVHIDGVTGSHPVNATPATTVFILLFDQFEEFFSYPQSQQDEFKAQLSELLYTAYPNFVRENRKNISEAELDFLSHDLDVRAVFAIRSDRLSDLDRLSRPLTAILKHRMELGALSEMQAEEAILRPAALPNDARHFKTEKFSFTAEALCRIKSALVGRDSNRIESFVLQIVCFTIEKTVERLRLTEIGANNLPDFNEVFDNYYRDQLAELPETDRAAAAHLLEFELLGYNLQTDSAHRRSVDCADLAASPALLEALERTYLIRREVNSFGRFSYEISHDTLLEPVVKARKIKEVADEEIRKETERLEAKTRAREAEARSMHETELREKAQAEQRRATLVTFIMIGLAIWAYFLKEKADKSSETIQWQNIELVKKEEELLFSLAKEKALKDTAEIRRVAADNATKDAKRLELAAKLERNKTEAALQKLKQETDPKSKIFFETTKRWGRRENFGAWKMKVDSLDFSGKGLSTLPEEIFECKNLRVLNLSQNNLTALPAQIGELKKLTTLYLDKNQLTELPAEIGELKDLTTLFLGDNKLTALPAQIRELKKLTALYLYENKLTALPVEIGELRKLTTLDLSNNQLTELPAEIGEMKKLEYLNLESNQLAALPEQIGEFKKLEILILGNNQLAALPEQIGELVSLVSLNLGNNQLTKLPEQIGELVSLVSLDLGNNQLTKLPAEIGELTELSELTLAFNKLAPLPPEIGELKKLVNLNLSNNLLTGLPAEIGELRKLEYLNLGNNQLTALPEQIGELKNLLSLNLGNNQLTELPAQIVELKKLKILILAGNLIPEPVQEKIIKTLPPSCFVSF